MRKPVIAGNWKMNTTYNEALTLALSISNQLENNIKSDVILCPPFVYINEIKEIIKHSNIKLGAQNIYPKNQGAFTGEISPEMLVSLGCKYVIIGHSERREYFSESNSFINQKIKACLSHNLIPILCVGEKLNERESDQTFSIIQTQLEQGLEGLADFISDAPLLIIAYEPIWAIGTGKVASPEQAQEVHSFIRQKLEHILNPNLSAHIRILYGGSVKPDNCKELMKQPDIDGALVGGASLNADSFCQIITLSH
ncbi:triose-phosphate isomerase [Thermoproteota archaeon]